MQRHLREPCLRRASPRRCKVENDEGTYVFFTGRNRLGAAIEHSGGRQRARLDLTGQVEGVEHSQRHAAMPLTIRSARRRAVGITKNPVIAATGHAIKYAFSHCRRKSPRRPRLSHVTSKVTIATMTPDMIRTKMKRVLASMAMLRCAVLRPSS